MIYLFLIAIYVKTALKFDRQHPVSFSLTDVFIPFFDTEKWSEIPLNHVFISDTISCCLQILSSFFQAVFNFVNEHLNNQGKITPIDKNTNRK